METMVYNNDREVSRRREIVEEIDSFISENDSQEFFSTRLAHRDNYLSQLNKLVSVDQVHIQRDSKGKITGVCGWARVCEGDSVDVNKVVWKLPEDVTSGDELYISFCLLTEGSIRAIRRELKRRYDNEIRVVYWFDVPHKKFFRVRNHLWRGVCVNA